jgi:hypothetical protein
MDTSENKDPKHVDENSPPPQASHPTSYPTSTKKTYNKINTFYFIVNNLPAEIVYKIFEYDSYKYSIFNNVVNQFEYICNMKETFLVSKKMKQQVLSMYYPPEKLLPYLNMTMRNALTMRNIRSSLPCCNKHCCYRFGNTNCRCCIFTNGNTYYNRGTTVSRIYGNKRYSLNLHMGGYCVIVTMR